MKVKFKFESDLSWTTQQIIEVQDNVTEEDIEAMFPIVLNVKYTSRNCSYEVVGDGHIYTVEETLKFSE